MVVRGFYLTLSGVLYGTRSAWLPALWWALVVTDEPVKADTVIRGALGATT